MVSDLFAFSKTRAAAKIIKEIAGEMLGSIKKARGITFPADLFSLHALRPHTDTIIC